MVNRPNLPYVLTININLIEYVFPMVVGWLDVQFFLIRDVTSYSLNGSKHQSTSNKFMNRDFNYILTTDNRLIE